MGFLKTAKGFFVTSYDSSPEATAAALAETRADLEAQIGQPVTALLVGLSPPGALRSPSGMAREVLLGWGASGWGHKHTGGTTDPTHHALLAVTGDGVLHLYRTRSSGGRYVIEVEAEAWEDDQARVRMYDTGTTVLVGVVESTGRVLTFELHGGEVVADVLARPFAVAVGTVID